MVSGIHAFLLIYIRQEASGKKQTAGVELVVVLSSSGSKLLTCTSPQGMDEAFVAQVDAYVRDAFFAVGCGFATEKTRSPRCTLEKSGAISMRSPT